MFGKQKSINWATVKKQITSNLVAAKETCPLDLVESPYVRLVLRRNSDVQFFSDVRDRKYVLGWGDLTAVLLREAPDDFIAWLNRVDGVEDMVGLVHNTEPFSEVMMAALKNKAAALGFS